MAEGDVSAVLIMMKKQELANNLKKRAEKQLIIKNEFPQIFLLNLHRQIP